MLVHLLPEFLRGRIRVVTALQGPIRIAKGGKELLNLLPLQTLFHIFRVGRIYSRRSRTAVQQDLGPVESPVCLKSIVEFPLSAGFVSAAVRFRKLPRQRSTHPRPENRHYDIAL